MPAINTKIDCTPSAKAAVTAFCGEYMRPTQAAEYLGVSQSYLAKFRVSGDGPVYSKPTPKLVLYRRRDLDAWATSSARTSTSQVVRGLA
jgi:hypothetical protein